MAYRRTSIDFGWDDEDRDNTVPRNIFWRPKFGGDLRNKRYSDAYGSYSGGYGPPGPPVGFRPEPESGPDFWPRGPPPQFFVGRHLGPGGPPPKRFAPEDRAYKYLMRCGIAKETLKNLPIELILLMEPQHCGICAESFDEYPSSRLHYISKNHQKSQKRWLSQKSEMGLHHKELPLKARELYCELCDVHITSTQHASSHYSGKPHRAIVEGRKNPKNPMLLQRVNEKRLEQLIRREKKHLNTVKESQQSQEAEEKKEKKFIQPDLYCDICKTSVTCSEQMTMHLNGKKHLSKEKQHILKMMQGEAPAELPDDTVQNEGEGDKADAIKDVGEAAEGEKEVPENFDWGNGSGAWDEPAQEQELEH